jgi:hypothetical protein
MRSRAATVQVLRRVRSVISTSSETGVGAFSYVYMISFF